MTRPRVVVALRGAALAGWALACGAPAAACSSPDVGQASGSSASVEAREGLRRGVELSRQGLHDGAAAELRRYLEAEPADAGARCLLGRSLLAIARRDGRSTEEAIAQLRRALDDDPAKDYIRLQLAEALGERREGTYRPEEALELYREVIRRDPDHYEARMLMAEWLLRSDLSGARALAEEQLDRVLDIAPPGSDDAARAASLKQRARGGS